MKSFAYPNLLIALVFTLMLGCNSGNQKNSNNSSSQNHSTNYSPSNDIPCFVYHRFGDNRYPSTNIPIDSFEKHLKALKKANFEVVTFGKAIDLLKEGKAAEKRYAVITVDDAYKSFITGAMPLLKKYDMPATVFVNTEGTGGNTYMSWDELQSIQKEGIEIGNHSHSHGQFLNKQGKEAVKKAFAEDTRKAQQQFKQHLGSTPDVYAYPYGEYSEAMKATLKDMDFKAAAAQHSGVLYPGSDFLALPRFPMAGPFVKLKDFKEKLNMKALRVQKAEPAEVTFTENPPTLTLTLNDSLFETDNLQCFISGSAKCKIDKDLSGDNPVFRLKSSQAMETRRFKYTITAPGKNGNDWYWYSKLWVMPEIAEGE